MSQFNSIYLSSDKVESPLKWLDRRKFHYLRVTKRSNFRRG